MKRIFGPVPSRRLGRSLGIDVIPYKTCTFDCVYCECGKTTDKTCKRREFYPLDELLKEVDHRLSEIPEKPDVLTLSGAGEPSLYSKMGELIIELKRMSSLPVAVITNSSLLAINDVREEMLTADIVLPSLDTAIEETFELINRPHEECSLEGIIDGLKNFLMRFGGRVLFEILLVDGFNTDERNLLALRDTLGRFRLDSIQLNTAVRPGTEKDIGPLDTESLGKIRALFGAGCEIVAGASTARLTQEDRGVTEKIIGLLERRPCTAEDIHRSLGIPVPGVVKIISALSEEGRVISETHGEKTFYTATKRDIS
ncbi:MAG: radical SAM protein [Candidatus Krumholzibacteria bacterium]|nr:radical SAM protein [Candidatus Krumholzibacteria bacterium]